MLGTAVLAAAVLGVFVVVQSEMRAYESVQADALDFMSYEDQVIATDNWLRDSGLDGLSLSNRAVDLNVLPASQDLRWVGDDYTSCMDVRARVSGGFLGEAVASLCESMRPDIYARILDAQISFLRLIAVMCVNHPSGPVHELRTTVPDDLFRRTLPTTEGALRRWFVDQREAGLCQRTIVPPNLVKRYPLLADLER